MYFRVFLGEQSGDGDGGEAHAGHMALPAGELKRRDRPQGGDSHTHARFTARHAARPTLATPQNIYQSGGHHTLQRAVPAYVHAVSPARARFPQSVHLIVGRGRTHGGAVDSAEPRGTEQNLTSPESWLFSPSMLSFFQALDDVPIFMRAFMGEVKTDIDDVLDVHHMVVTNLVKNKSLMNRVSADAPRLRRKVKVAAAPWGGV